MLHMHAANGLARLNHLRISKQCILQWSIVAPHIEYMCIAHAAAGLLPRKWFGKINSQPPKDAQHFFIQVAHIGFLILLISC